MSTFADPGAVSSLKQLGNLKLLPTRQELEEFVPADFESDLRNVLFPLKFPIQWEDSRDEVSIEDNLWR